ncbi:hypothetical protein [Enterococcus gallinarum]|uniref:hypothetical protein n=1 Tax=Enterococcus TaxID=1350 RepID=UPI003F75F972
MSDKLAVLMEFNEYTKDELEAYLSLKFGSMTKGGMTASILSQSGYEKAKSVIFDQPQLDEDQQQVLDWLKWSFEDQGNSSMDAIYLLRLGEAIDSVLLSYMALTKKDQTEVLQAFVQWALEQEEE